jgi:hypothetical protein
MYLIFTCFTFPEFVGNVLLITETKTQEKLDPLGSFWIIYLWKIPFSKLRQTGFHLPWPSLKATEILNGGVEKFTESAYNNLSILFYD